jgi:hypothetical protein
MAREKTRRSFPEVNGLADPEHNPKIPLAHIRAAAGGVCDD